METPRRKAIDSRCHMSTAIDVEITCKHHWLLGQPENGRVSAVCRNCGRERSYPAVLDDADWNVENERRYISLGVATAAGGARPSSGASQEEAAERW
jgi:hypothetical protein